MNDIAIGNLTFIDLSPCPLEMNHAKNDDENELTKRDYSKFWIQGHEKNLETDFYLDSSSRSCNMQIGAKILKFSLKRNMNCTAQHIAISRIFFLFIY